MLKASTYTVGVDESSVAMEFAFVKVSLVDHAIWECEFALTFFPVVLLGALVLTARPL